MAAGPGTDTSSTRVATEYQVRVIFLPDARPDPADVKAKARRQNAGPHDILIVGGKVWQFADGVAFEHPHKGGGHGHPAFAESILIVHPGDSIAWNCPGARSITVRDMKPVPRTLFLDHFVPDVDPALAETEPFSNKLPYENATAGEPARSGVVKPSAQGSQYKLTIVIDGVSYDPDIFCDNQ